MKTRKRKTNKIKTKQVIQQRQTISSTELHKAKLSEIQGEVIRYIHKKRKFTKTEAEDYIDVVTTICDSSECRKDCSIQQVCGKILRQMKTIIEEKDVERGDTERIDSDSGSINLTPSAEQIRNSQSTSSNIDNAENIENLSNSFRLVDISDILIAPKQVSLKKLNKRTTPFDTADSMIGEKKSKTQRLVRAKIKQQNIKPIIQKTRKLREIRKSINKVNIPETIILDSDDETQIYTIESISTNRPSNTNAFHNANMDKQNNNTSRKYSTNNVVPIRLKTNVKNLKIRETTLTTIESDDETPDIYTSKQHAVMSNQLDLYSNTEFSKVSDSIKETNNKIEAQITAVDNYDIDRDTMLPFESIIDSQVTQLTFNRNSPSILTGFKEVYNDAAITENQMLDQQLVEGNKPDRDIERRSQFTNTYTKPIIHTNCDTQITLSNGQTLTTLTRVLDANTINIGPTARCLGIVEGLKLNEGSYKPLRTINMIQLSNEKGTENTTRNYPKSFANVVNTANTHNQTPVTFERKDVNTNVTTKHIEDYITSYAVIKNKQIADNLHLQKPTITNVCCTDTAETNLNVLSQNTLPDSMNSIPNSMNSIPDSQKINPDPDTHAKLFKCLLQPKISKVTKRNRAPNTNKKLKSRSKSNVKTQNKELLKSISSKTNSCTRNVLFNSAKDKNNGQEQSWIENIKFVRCIDPDEYLPIELNDSFWRENITFPGLMDADFSLYTMFIESNDIEEDNVFLK